MSLTAGIVGLPNVGNHGCSPLPTVRFWRKPSVRHHRPTIGAVEVPDEGMRL